MHNRPLLSLSLSLATFLGGITAHADSPAPPAASAPASKSLIPDDQIQKLAALVQTDQLADARRLAFAFTLLYPEDVRVKEWQTRLDQLAASTKPVATSPSEPTPPKPSPAAEDDTIKRQVDRELRVIKLAYADAQKLKDDKGEATEPYYQALDAILARPDPFKSESPAQIPYYATRAQLALEAGDPWIGFPTVAKLNALGADKLPDDSYADLYANLDKRRWLAPDIATCTSSISGEYKISSIRAREYYANQGWVIYESSGSISLPSTSQKKATGAVTYKYKTDWGGGVKSVIFEKAPCRFFDIDVRILAKVSINPKETDKPLIIGFKPGADIIVEDGIATIQLTRIR